MQVYYFNVLLKEVFVMRTGLEPVTPPCVIDDTRFELAREVLNIHLTLKGVPRRTDFPLFGNHQMIFKMVYTIYTGRYSNHLN